MADDHVVQIYELMERLSGEQRAEVLHKLLTWFRNDELAIKTVGGWARQAARLRELDEAVTDAWAAQGDAPELWLPPGVALSEDAPGAGDLELEEMAGVALSLQLEIILFGIYRHELVARAEAADHPPALGSRTLLTEPPALPWQELAVLGLMEIEDASQPGQPQWLAMLTPVGRLRAHRVAKQQLARLTELEDGDRSEGHQS